MIVSGPIARGVALALASLLAGCTVGPDYVRPDADVPSAYKEMPAAKAMPAAKVAEPREAEPRGRWWAIYDDPQLDALQAAVTAANQDLRSAEANYRQSIAFVAQSRAGLYPAIGATADATRARQRGVTASQYSLAAPIDWEIDLWGRVRRSVESAEDTAQASAADLESMRLSLHAQLAQSYFALRATDRGKKLLDDTVAAYQRGLQLTQNRYNAGVAARSDVVQAETQLQNAQVQAVDIGVTRAQLEHAIAVLIGKPASEFSLPPIDRPSTLPAIPAAVPSELLERRPDIAAAERRVAAANAQIGVATAAFYPTVSLSGSIGFASATLGSWLALPNRAWSLGASLATPLFDAGLRQAQRDETIAAYDATVAQYRKTVLTGFQDVEDGMSTLRILEEEDRVQVGALQSARRALELGLNQYRAGLINYIDVVALQAIAFNAERNSVELEARRLAASVALVKALGGGFEASSLASAR